MRQNKNIPIYNDGLVTIYKVKSTTKSGVMSNVKIADCDKVCELHYGDSTVSYKDSEITEGHDVVNTVKIKVDGTNTAIKAGMYCTVKSFRTGKEEFCRIYASDPNYSKNQLFVYAEEVRHGGYS